MSPTLRLLLLLFPTTVLMRRITLAALPTSSAKRNISDEQRLFRFVLREYDRALRPLYNSSDLVTVGLGITLIQIADFDERNQVLATIVWLDQEWIDQKLQWEPERFGGLRKIRLPCQLIWLPDIVLYNSVDDHYRGYMQSLAMIDYTGHVFWPPIVKMRSSCKIDIKWFPFDSQVCFLKLGSWAYDGNQVDVTNRTTEVDLSNFVPSGEWDVMETRVIRNVKWYPCSYVGSCDISGCPEPFPDMMFYLHLQRRHLYYMMNIILPCMMMSLLTMTTFALPAESGEKITLGLTVMLSFSVFMLLIAETMPPTSESAPLASIYLTIIMGLSAASVMMSVVVLNVHTRGRTMKPPPRLVKTICRYMAVILLCKFEESNMNDDFGPPEQATASDSPCCFNCGLHLPKSKSQTARADNSASNQTNNANSRSSNSVTAEDASNSHRLKLFSRARWRRLKRRFEMADSTNFLGKHRAKMRACSTDGEIDNLSSHTNGLVYANVDLPEANLLQTSTESAPVSASPPTPPAHSHVVPTASSVIPNTNVHPLGRNKKGVVTFSNFSLDLSAEGRERVRFSQPKPALSDVIAKRMASPLHSRVSIDADSENGSIWQPQNGYTVTENAFPDPPKPANTPEHSRELQICECGYVFTSPPSEKETPFTAGTDGMISLSGKTPTLFECLGGARHHWYLMQRERIVTQWQDVSIVLDRLLLAIFVGATLLVSISMLVIVPQSRNYYSDTILGEAIDRDRRALDENNEKALAAYNASLLG